MGHAVVQEVVGLIIINNRGMGFETFENIENLKPQEVVNDSVEALEQNNNELSELHSECPENLEVIDSRLETMEFLTDLEMVEGIANYLETLPEIRYENWSELSLKEKEILLNKIEQNIAAIEHRPALKVELEEMSKNTLGYQSASENKIVLNSLYVNSNDPSMHREVIDTIIHEGRHAYQHYNVDVKMIHESWSEVLTWAENFYDPQYRYYQTTGQKIVIPFKDGSLHDVDFRLYYYQPVEIDARNFASDIMDRLEAKGVINNSHNNQ